MKKSLRALSVPICLIVFSSCKKDDKVVLVPETSNQVLTKIIKSVQLDNNNSYQQVINYEYNPAGRLTGVGDTKYVRDDQQRITQIDEKNSLTNRNQVFVYYNRDNPKQVDYTIAAWSGQVQGDDSIVYIHDEAGRLTKTMTYYRQPAGTYMNTANYYQYAVPDSNYLGKYTIFAYDPDGNIIDLSFYSIGEGGRIVLCGKYTFYGYSKTVNPQYSDDEVRIADYTFYATLNVSKNNFSTVGHLTKSYEYRADGRPRKCIVEQDGVKSFTLEFEYR